MEKNKHQVIDMLGIFTRETELHFGLFFEYVQIRTELFKKVSKALKITEKKKTLICHYIN